MYAPPDLPYMGMAGGAVVFEKYALLLKKMCDMLCVFRFYYYLCTW